LPSVCIHVAKLLRRSRPLNEISHRLSDTFTARLSHREAWLTSSTISGSRLSPAQGARSLSISFHRMSLLGIPTQPVILKHTLSVHTVGQSIPCAMRSEEHTSELQS